MSKVRVLIVDDTPLVIKSLEGMLQLEEDLEVVGSAMNAYEAVEKARELKPDLVLMDFSMPGMDGIDAGRAIKTDRSETKVIILSANDCVGNAERAKDAGIAGWLPKDLAPDELISSIQSVALARERRHTKT